MDLNSGLACDQGRKGINYSRHIIIGRGSAQIVYRLCLLPDHFGAIYSDDQNFEGEVFRMAESWSAFFDMLYLIEDDVPELLTGAELKRSQPADQNC